MLWKVIGDMGSRAAAKLPEHIAIVMDGNGRWAKARGLPRRVGHRQGAENMRHIIRACLDFGIRYLTLYAFSTENWKRPPSEVDYLMSLPRQFYEREKHLLHEHQVRVVIEAVGTLGVDLTRKVAGTGRLTLLYT